MGCVVIASGSRVSSELVSARYVHVMYAIRNVGQAIRALYCVSRGLGKDALRQGVAWGGGEWKINLKRSRSGRCGSAPLVQSQRRASTRENIKYSHTNRGVLLKY